MPSSQRNGLKKRDPRGDRNERKRVKTGNHNGRYPYLGGKKRLDLVRAEPERTGLMFVLDTNILMTNPTALWNFKEHNLLIPFKVLMELDRCKRVEGERGFHARQAIDSLVTLVEKVPREKLKDGIPLIRLDGKNGGQEKYGKLFFGKPTPEELRLALDPNIPDHAILLECLEYKDHAEQHGKIVIVSKDKVMRIVALLIGLPAEDYFEDAINTQDLRSTGVHKFPYTFWERQNVSEPTQKVAGQRPEYVLRGKELEDVEVNEFLCITKKKGDPKTLDLQVIEKRSPQVALVRKVIDYTNRPVLGLTPRNKEQNFALNVLLDPEIKVVILEGPAGSGKNFITLLAAYYQIMEKNMFDTIVATRDAIPVGQELGFKPGSEREKMLPWMGGMVDNAQQIGKFMNKRILGKQKNEKDDMVSTLLSLLDLREINSMRGRSFHRTFLILDENQNSDRAQQKLFLTRPAEGSKVVCLGNFKQADKILNSRTSGLSRVIAVSRGWKRAAHLIMPSVERGEVSAYYEDRL